MIGAAIPFKIPADFQVALAAGEIVRRGALLKDVQSGRIIAHLQETGILENAIHAGTSLISSGPVGAATGLFGVLQNEQIKSRLSAIQGSLGTIQALQVASLASSVIGIGVTMASTAMILNRISQVQRSLSGVGDKVDGLSKKISELKLADALRRVETQLERLAEVPLRKATNTTVVQDAEAALHDGFNELHHGAEVVAAEVQLDGDLLLKLLGGLALCGSAQVKALLWLDEIPTARNRAERQARKIQEFSLVLPRDQVARRLGAGKVTAGSLSSDISELRLRMASQAALVADLSVQEISGRRYIEAAEERTDTPLLLLPSASPR